MRSNWSWRAARHCSAQYDTVIVILVMRLPLLLLLDCLQLSALVLPLRLRGGRPDGVRKRILLSAPLSPRHGALLRKHLSPCESLLCRLLDGLAAPQYP